ncbi:lysophospholipid acyltransferase family protein [candidate division WOR-3 bacterium]|nr:lysophospholipid acyltransferase family protein [candidate division WOR-3 bacterium]MCK4528380.1 lysophospholipid acyltransferase family protein [candidate division WOR-3 bacterium]
MALQITDMKQFLMLILTQLLRFTTIELKDSIARVGGFLWYIVAGERREIVRENLKTIKGRVNESDVRRIFINFALVYSDILNIPNMTPSYLHSMVKSEDVDLLKIELERGKGVILVASHLGGMELAGPYLSILGYSLFSVAESKGPGMDFFRFYLHYRERFGSTILRLEEKRLAFTLIRLLKENKIVVLVGDRDIQGTGVDCEFFGRVTPFPRGVSLLAKKAGAPLIVGFMTLDTDTPRYITRFFPPLYPEDYDSVEDLMKATIELFEKEISMYPEQWFVFQRVWKEKSLAKRQIGQ